MLFKRKKKKPLFLKRLASLYKRKLRRRRIKQLGERNLYAFWRNMYISKLISADKLTQRFVKLLRTLRHQKKTIKPDYKK